MKTIIKRNLPLNVKYTLVDKKYIPLMDGGGCACDNCGTLIANIATVKSSNGTYSIGFDCLETFLLNNNLLEGFGITDLEKVKKMIQQIIRFSKNLKETIANNPRVKITGFTFEPPMFETNFTYYILTNGQTKSRNNAHVKLKNMDLEFLLDTLRHIFPTLSILKSSD